MSQCTKQEIIIIIIIIIIIFFLYSLDTIHIKNTLKPPVSNHPKLKDLVVAYENRGGIFQEKVPTHVIFGSLFVAYNF